jgi:aconitase B
MESPKITKNHQKSLLLNHQKSPKITKNHHYRWGFWKQIIKNHQKSPKITKNHYTNLITIVIVAPVLSYGNLNDEHQTPHH